MCNLSKNGNFAANLGKDNVAGEFRVLPGSVLGVLCRPLRSPSTTEVSSGPASSDHPKKIEKRSANERRTYLVAHPT